MSRQPRFEICRGDDGWWARFRAANGRVVWVTETYQRRRATLAAIYMIARPLPTRSTPWHLSALTQAHGALEIRDVDERA